MKQMVTFAAAVAMLSGSAMAQSPVLQGLQVLQGDSLVIGMNLSTLMQADADRGGINLRETLEQAKAALRGETQSGFDNVFAAAAVAALVDEETTASAVVATVNGFNPMNPMVMPAISAAVVGDYDGEAFAAKMEMMGFTAGEEEGTFTALTRQGGTITATMPEIGVILFRELGDQPAELFETAINTTAPESRFSSTARATGGNIPDFFLFSEGNYVRQAAQGNPMAAQFAGPLLRANGFLLALADTTTNNPKIDLHSSFADANAAQLAGNTMTELVNLGRMFAGGTFNSGPNATPEEAKMASIVNGILNDIQIAPRGETMSLRIPIGRITQDEELLQMLEDSPILPMMMGF